MGHREVVVLGPAHVPQVIEHSDSVRAVVQTNRGRKKHNSPPPRSVHITTSMVSSQREGAGTSMATPHLPKKNSKTQDSQLHGNKKDGRETSSSNTQPGNQRTGHTAGNAATGKRAKSQQPHTHTQQAANQPRPTHFRDPTAPSTLPLAAASVLKSVNHALVPVLP